MIKSMLYGMFFYGILAVLLHYAQVSQGYGIAIYVWAVVMDISRYVIGVRKGLICE